jgi:hypothetical protein
VSLVLARRTEGAPSEAGLLSQHPDRFRSAAGGREAGASDGVRDATST